MQEIRFHGRGGQGTVLASIALAKAFFAAGFEVQTFPLFGSERRGAPVEAYLRLDHRKILVRSNLYQPDHVVVLDPHLLGLVDVTRGLKPGGWILLNAPALPADLRPFQGFRLAWVDAARIALGHGLGSSTHPIVNTAMLGAFARVLGAPPLEAVAEAIRNEMPRKPGPNAEAARDAHAAVTLAGLVPAAAPAEAGPALAGPLLIGPPPTGAPRTDEPADPFRVPLFFTRATASTAVNRTGGWSFVQPIYREQTAPCSHACPCGTEVPRVEALATEGRHGAAWRLLLMENPLPGVCGRVCFHPCEEACNRGQLDGPVAIHSLERFLADQAERDAAPDQLVPAAPTGRRVAVLGAGPAGLAAAYFLARLGHACELFEAAAAPGGLLRWGIPAYRLPAAVLDREIGRLQALGVRITCNTTVDARILDPAGFDAVCVTCGQGRPLGLGIPGADLALDGLALLREARSPEGAPPAGAGVAAVIGGGNTAIDVARTLLRQGLKPLIVYRRGREAMPAFGHEVDRALAEGVELLEHHIPLALSRDADGLRLRLQTLRATGPGPDGRPRLEPVPGASHERTVARVYTAIGTAPDPVWRRLLDQAPGPVLARARLTRMERPGRTGRGALPVALAGDLTTSRHSVSEAIASGKEAALALDALFQDGPGAVADRLADCRVGAGPALSMERYLGGPRARREARVIGFADLNPAYFPPRIRVAPAQLPVRASVRSFQEVELGLPVKAAAGEASRCFNCGICNGCDNCRTFCPDAAVRVAGDARSIALDYCKGCGVCVEECPRGAMVMGTAEGGRP